jgi:hypothetical protein
VGARGPRVSASFSVERVHLSAALAIKQTDAATRSETTRFRTKIINTRLPSHARNRCALSLLNTYLYA